MIGITNADGDIFTRMDFNYHGGVGLSYAAFKDSRSIIQEMRKKVSFMIGTIGNNFIIGCRIFFDAI